MTVHVVMTEWFCDDLGLLGVRCLRSSFVYRVSLPSHWTFASGYWTGSDEVRVGNDLIHLLFYRK